MEVISTLLFL